ncbi:MAG: exonuclease SbcCD subunit D [Clostridiales bacterium]|uniref:exonuclease SbcCD subunit D n=1 Tax=Terrisporobacter sp. TaxID=1965305 RepID=UPI002A580227|nr:exonuclease SbcCD subunit D [Terrisporobacter sp.]MCI5629457.1 exonuclease SbcCD subunit D [Clostridium sp.]MDD7753164.1 exonuclease SbcCD subunit D [Clostridiales bacterium]MDY4134106.1 exonuclease SbcCD subunit D [Terrisporobacter sp.]MDY4736760.1 exonuclease SbcCD subunit D [Terrisporobacter sp.]MDY6152074.1 exonuclease SbcCD subunit D [Terrisporobacter sp.]
MKFIHTSDWHIGKNLEGHSRLEEQEKFCDDFVKIVEENNIDMVIIAGDVYDTSNPPAGAETLFYKTICRLADDGNRCVLVIAGNHDNPERLSAVSPLAKEQGIIILGYPLSSTTESKYKGFEITEAGRGYLKLKIGGEKATIITLPYPSEKRLNDAIRNVDDENELQKNYSNKVGDIFRKLEENFEEDSINIAVSHLFVSGGDPSDSERQIQLGGSLVVDKHDLPQKAQYTALGHLHKPQKASERLNVYYSGSPLQYSVKERIYAKGANIVEIHANETPVVEQVYFNNYKPIEVFKCDGIEEALKVCEENKDRDIWSYFEIKTDEVISQENIKKMKEYLKDIIEIKPIITSHYEEENIDLKEKSMAQLFNDFYKFKEKCEPRGELMDLFLNIVSEEGEENETN